MTHRLRTTALGLYSPRPGQKCRVQSSANIGTVRRDRGYQCLWMAALKAEPQSTMGQLEHYTEVCVRPSLPEAYRIQVWTELGRTYVTKALTSLLLNKNSIASRVGLVDQGKALYNMGGT